jgi:hypothetical protein
MKVFISHSPENNVLAKKVGKALARAGWDVWDDEQKILPGDNWAQKIGQALEESEAMVVLLTPDALSSSNVRRDIEYALGSKSYNNRLIPVLVCSEESMPVDDFPWIFGHLKMINLKEFGREEEGISQIAEALRATAA